jgi:hypothetical protein
LLVLLLAACTASPTGSLGNLIGTHDLVIVDDLPTNGGVAFEPPVPDGGTDPSPPNPAVHGVRGRYVFIASADTNELKVLNLYRPGLAGRTFVPAPNPLESLSIPVLERPSVLACDEGLTEAGVRVTGPFVYAIRPGGDQLSVVDATPAGFIQATRDPLTAPAPITAIVGWMGDHLATIPDTTTVYYATWDGSSATLYALPLPTARSRRTEVKRARPVRVLDLGPEVIVALKVLPGLPGRNLDGAPFCAGPSACMAVATRTLQGSSGRQVLIELDALRVAPLAFPGPVKELSATGRGERLYGLLDEEHCQSDGCGGAIEVDTRQGTVAGGFPVWTDFTGQPMQPIRAVSTLSRGLTVAHPTGYADLALPQILEADGGSLLDATVGLRTYPELAFFSTSAGEVVAIDGVSGTPIDFDGRRTSLVSASVKIPLLGPDGGYMLYLQDGGVNYEYLTASVVEDPFSDGGTSVPYRHYTVVADGGSRVDDTPSGLDLADGYLLSQNLTVVRNGFISGFLLGATSPDAGNAVTFTAGLESRLIKQNDYVVFAATQLDGGLDQAACGEALIVDVQPGVATFSAVPPGCEQRVLYSIRAGDQKSLVVTGDVEGHLGRIDDGEVLTYTRRYLVRPDGWDGVRPALRFTPGTMPAPRGSVWSFAINGYLNTYRFSFDANTITCSSYAPGHLKVAPIPTYVSDQATSFQWGVTMLYPATNGIVLAPLSSLHDNVAGGVTLSEGVACFR